MVITLDMLSRVTLLGKLPISSNKWNPPLSNWNIDVFAKLEKQDEKSEKLSWYKDESSQLIRKVNLWGKLTYRLMDRMTTLLVNLLLQLKVQTAV